MIMNGLIVIWCLVGVLFVLLINDGVLVDVFIVYYVVSKVIGVFVDILYVVVLMESGKVYEVEGGWLLLWFWVLNINGVSVYCVNFDVVFVLSWEVI